MKKCFDYPSYYCRSDLSFQVGTLLGYDYTCSNVGLKLNVYRNCCEVVAKAEQWGCGGMVDTLVLGTSLFGGGSSSLLDPTNFLRMSFKNIGSVLLMCVDAIKVWGNLLELPNSFLKELGSR